ncbi:hypothetical protein CDAR_71901 [Caerostris darwini]|uniref:Uncharacterized protein n=1 Tax=Caerostris darwini TaxID=1538125 RepID=A0AAV4TJ84_9ARAC|nr:hypothetical protein CDAR_71901 [Caerostris darwini]
MACVRHLLLASGLGSEAAIDSPGAKNQNQRSQTYHRLPSVLLAIPFYFYCSFSSCKKSNKFHSLQRLSTDKKWFFAMCVCQSCRGFGIEMDKNSESDSKWFCFRTNVEAMYGFYWCG